MSETTKDYNPFEAESLYRRHGMSAEALHTAQREARVAKAVLSATVEGVDPKTIEQYRNVVTVEGDPQAKVQESYKVWSELKGRQERMDFEDAANIVRAEVAADEADAQESKATTELDKGLQEGQAYYAAHQSEIVEDAIRDARSDGYEPNIGSSKPVEHAVNVVPR